MVVRVQDEHKQLRIMNSLDFCMALMKHLGSAAGELVSTYSHIKLLQGNVFFFKVYVNCLCHNVLLKTLLYKLTFYLFHALFSFYQTYHESRDTTLGSKAYNGDLAEADQSHHEEPVVGIPELEAESAASMCVAEEVPTEGHSIQAEGASTIEPCIVNNAADAAEVICSVK